MTHRRPSRARFFGALSLLALLGCGASSATATGQSAQSEASPEPGTCVARAAGLQEVTAGATPAGPYFVHHPDPGVTDADTIFFVPGGPGSRDTAQATFTLWLSRGASLGHYRIVVPFAADGDLTDEGDRLVPVLDEVLACYGGSAARVHLAGTSNGGRAAFALMLRSPERFVSLLGSPGLFDAATDAQLRVALGGRPVLDVAGELDAQWRPRVKATVDRLVGLGVDAAYAELPGQGHILDATANQEVFFGFWGRQHP